MGPDNKHQNLSVPALCGDLDGLRATLTDARFVSYCFLSTGGFMQGYSANADNYYGIKIEQEDPSDIAKVPTYFRKGNWKPAAIVVGCLKDDIGSDDAIKNGPAWGYGNYAAAQYWVINQKTNEIKLVMFGEKFDIPWVPLGRSNSDDGCAQYSLRDAIGQVDGWSSFWNSMCMAIKKLGR